LEITNDTGIEGETASVVQAKLGALSGRFVVDGLQIVPASVAASQVVVGVCGEEEQRVGGIDGAIIDRERTRALCCGI